MERLAVALCVLRIIGVTTNFPEIGEHGLLAAGGVLLRHEVDLILRDVLQVTLTRFDGSRYRRETVTIVDLVLAQRSGALHGFAEVQTVTLVALGRCRTVRAKEHFGTRVLTALARFCECSGYTVDTGTPFYFSHSLLAILRRKRLTMTSLLCNS